MNSRQAADSRKAGAKTASLESIPTGAAINIGRQAAEALRTEAGVSPKPGLVDRENNGAHRDMDYAMFLRSAGALESCFCACAQAGLDTAAKHGDTDALAAILRRIGKDGEAAMLAATEGVNTHKGAIFSMGIFCCALGMLAEQGLTASALQDQCAAIARSLLGDGQGDIAPGQGAEETHGTKVRRETGADGIKGEALSGFAAAFATGLPALERALEEGHTMEEAMIVALLNLMTVCEDSNLVYRGGLKGLVFVQNEAARLLREANLRTEEGKEKVRAFDQTCVARNLSPGGSADLLALTVMIYGVLKEQKKGEER